MTRPFALALTALLAASCRGNDNAPTPDSVKATSAASATGAVSYVATVVHSYPHDPAAFTEGLFIKDGKLYESTGLEGKSDVRRVDLATGNVELRHALPPQYFGEGIAAINGVLYQLTYKTGKAFTYDLATLTPRAQTFTYPGQGWGMTTDGESLIMSDSTARLRFLDPKTFAVRRTLDVHDGASPISLVNELEWVKGELFANVWQSDQIVRIDPKTGAVTGWVDLAGILPVTERTGREDVLNGIAYDSVADKLYVTGKLWPKLFEIRLDRR